MPPGHYLVTHGDRVAADDGQGEVLGQAVHRKLFALGADWCPAGA
jgi:hypothetical protein